MKLNIGSGPNVFPFPDWTCYDHEDVSAYIGYIRAAPNLDGMPEYQKPLARYLQSGGPVDFRVHDLRAGFPQHGDGSIDAIYLGQVIEHLNPIYEVPKLLRECKRMLKPGGVLRIATPDLDLLIDAYRTGQMGKFAVEQPDFYRTAEPSAQLSLIMYGAAGPNCTWDRYEGHMCLFTKRSMAAALSEAGFAPPFEFYYEAGKSLDPVLAAEVQDAGMSHSFITEARA